MSNRVVYQWGQSQPIAPSVKRVDVLGWMVASAMGGLIAGLLVLAALWRPLPMLPGPPGALAEHATACMRLLAHALWPGAYRFEAKDYLDFLGSLPDSQRIAMIWRIATALWASMMPAVFLAKSCLEPRDGLIHIRGSKRYEGEEAVSRLKAALAKRIGRRPDHEIAPGIVYPADMWTRHALLVGGVGSGKSTVLKPLIRNVIASGEQLILFDPKGEFTMGFKRPSIVAPWDSRSCSWDIAKDMRNIGDMRRFAAAMVREGQDPMWANASRQLMVGIMLYLKATRGTRWGWREFAELIAKPQAQLYPIMSKYHQEAIRSVEKASVTTHGILINLSSFCAPVFDLAAAWGDMHESRRISFVDWAKGNGKHRQVILQGHGAYPELTKGYVEGIVGVVSALVASVEMEEDPNRKLWFIADEFAQMGKIPVRTLFEMGRGRGVRCVVACQDLSQLEEVHGASMVKALVSMSGAILVGQMMQGETAEQLAKALGSREVERPNVSTSYPGAGGGANGASTVSFVREEIALYKPSEFASRLGLTEDGLGVRLALCIGGNVFELYWPMFGMRRERLAHRPAPWTRGVPACDGDAWSSWVAEHAGTVNFEVEPSMEALSTAPAPLSTQDVRVAADAAANDSEERPTKFAPAEAAVDTSATLIEEWNRLLRDPSENADKENGVGDSQMAGRPAAKSSV
jgi:hypothetical protein